MSQDVMDALADAETLRRVMRELMGPLNGVSGARIAGGMALDWASRGHTDNAAWAAREAARHAFAEVPALRAEAA
jgi:hypothetical protein